jgi:hypothetical protein
MRKLNGWERIGVILSVIWIPYGFFKVSGAALDDATASVSQRLRQCVENSPVELESKCKASFDHDWPIAVANSHHWLWGIAGALIPILLGWLFAWGLVLLFKWVVAGFRKPPSVA